MKHVLWQLVICADQLFNCFCYWLPGGVWADETLSSRAHRIQAAHPRLRAWINRLFFWQEDHCRDAYQSEMVRRHLPPELRT